MQLPCGSQVSIGVVVVERGGKHRRAVFPVVRSRQCRRVVIMFPRKSADNRTSRFSYEPPTIVAYVTLLMLILLQKDLPDCHCSDCDRKSRSLWGRDWKKCSNRLPILPSTCAKRYRGVVMALPFSIRLWKVLEKVTVQFSWEYQKGKWELRIRGIWADVWLVKSWRDNKICPVWLLLYVFSQKTYLLYRVFGKHAAKLQ